MSNTETLTCKSCAREWQRDAGTRGPKPQTCPTCKAAAAAERPAPTPEGEHPPRIQAVLTLAYEAISRARGEDVRVIEYCVDRIESGTHEDPDFIAETLARRIERMGR